MILNKEASGSRIAVTLPGGRLMPIAKITGQGLAAIALSVGLLWACLVGERLTLNRAVARRAEVMRELRQLQLRNRTVPASTPIQRRSNPSRVTIG
jgi:hypothetical protein